MRKRVISVLTMMMILIYVSSGMVSAKVSLDSEADSVKTQTLSESEGVVYPALVVKPPSSSHPRVYFTQKDIPKIKDNFLNEENQYAYSTLKSQVDSTVSANAEFSDSRLSAIESKAFYHAITKDAVSQEDINNWIEVIKAVKPTNPTSLQYRRYGRMINVLSEIYDWCYDALSESGKTDIINTCLAYAEKMGIGWPPTKQGSLTGHAAEYQLMRDLMSFAIAVYDERPDIWEIVGGRFYEEYVPAIKFVNRGNYNMQGTSYGYYREAAVSFAYALITGMGAEEPFPIDDMVQTALSEIYLKRPDGNIFVDGDFYANSVPPFSYYQNETSSLLIRAMKGNNGYLKGEYLKETLEMSYGTISQNFQEKSPVLFLILNDPNLEVKTTNSLSLSRYYGSPVGMLVARTGFKSGKKSDSVAVMMKFGEYMLNNHQHLDAGNFQIYYKGLLATEGGNYDVYEDDGHNMYTRKSVAHNTVLVDDPDEVKRNADGSVRISRSNVNDGGQKPPNDYSEYASLEKLLADPLAKRAEVTAYEIDPTNTQKPGYSYMKGNLTNAYSDKVTDFERSFMFLNLDDAEIPAALIVFDRVCSSNANFKKSWLLHGLQAPTIESNVAVFKNDTNGYDSKMEVKTLLPLQDNLESTVVDGATVKGYEYDDEKKAWSEIRSDRYVYAEAEKGSELNTYRLQLSPRKPSNEDFFLNVITVGDSESAISVDAKLYECENHYGTIVKDRAVFFGKNNVENETFCVSVPSGSYQYTVCDMKKGTYKVTTETGTTEVSVSENGKVLAFEGGGGNITVVRSNDICTAPEDAARMLDEKMYYIKSGSEFIAETENCSDSEGTVYVAGIVEKIGLKISKAGDNTYVIDSDGIRLAEITVGESSVITKSGIYVAETTPYLDNGRLVMKYSDLCNVIFCDNKIYDSGKILFVEKLSSDKYSLGTTVYYDCGRLSVYVKVKQGFSADLFCGVYKEGVLIAAKKLERQNEGVYSTELKGIPPEYNVKVFPWINDMRPFNSVISPHSFGTGVLTVNSQQAGTLGYTDRGNTTVKSDGKKTVVSKSGATEQASAQTKISGYALGDDGYLLYSASLRVVKKSCENEKLQFRLRDGSTKQFYSAFSLPAYVGTDAWICALVDLKNAKLYFYINGREIDERSLESWKDSDGNGATIGSIEYFFINSPGEKGGCFELFDSYLSRISGEVNIDEIIGNLSSVDFNLSNII